MASYRGVATSIPKLHTYMINIVMRVTILALSLCKMKVMKVTHATFVQFPIVNVLFLNNHMFGTPRNYM